MEQIRDGVLTLLVLCAHVSVQYVHDVAMLIKTAVHIIIKLHITSFMQNWMICMYLIQYFTYGMLSKLWYLWEDLIEVL